MAKWWQMSAAKLAASPAAQKERQEAYYETFLASDAGREVLADLERTAEVQDCQGTFSERAIVQWIARAFVETIVERCGPCDRVKLIESRQMLTDPAELPAGIKEEKPAGAYDII
jgi:hypothetical protein